MTRPDSSTRLPGENGSTGRASATAPGRFEPGRRLGRFRLERLLGRGGMGQVFEAWDPHLKRRVAVKLRLEAPGQHLERFLREARSLAALSHPGICPVYEVGEEDGVPFIVMQRLEGLALDEAAEGLGLEVTLHLVEQVAEAVHAAHAAGLIHRDLKPGNVLVEIPEDGPPRPYVLDFGLARFEDAEALTREGSVAGTPAYMAPEQVEGDASAVGPRTDVYALGATLYRLLAGRPPFEGSGAGLLLEVVVGEPPTLPPSVPAEVAHIVLKCLEKEPERRYASARDLAQDLRRYLDGEPVEARPPSTGYRLVKWVRRHRPLAASLLVLLLVIALAVGWNHHAERLALHRQGLVSSFVEQVEQIEALVRYSHMSPLHDIRPDRQLLRSRMAAIRRDMEANGPLVAGAGHFALGSGHLALEELEEAHRHLELAWSSGYQTGEVAAALTQALSALYRRHLSAIELVQDWELRSRRLDQLEEVYGRAVRASLDRGRSGSVASPLLDALDHFHSDRFEAALAELQASRQRRPWSYELPRLEGEIRRAWAIERAVEGDREGARRQLELAFEVYGRAASIASSDPSIHRGIAEVAFQKLRLGGAETEVPAELVVTGLDAAERALVINPRDARAWLWKARLHRLDADGRQAKGEDPSAPLELADAAARRAAQGLEPASEAWRELALGQWSRALWLESRGRDPREPLASAEAALDRVQDDDRDYFDFHLTAMIHQTRGRHRRSRGEAAAADLGAAIAAYRAAIDRHSTPFGAWVNLGTCSLWLAELPEIEEGEPHLLQAVEAFTRAQALKPSHGLPAYYLGRAYLRLAQGGDRASEDLDDSWTEKSLAAYRRAFEQAPSMFQAQVGLGEVHHLLALRAAGRGEATEVFFERARAAYRRALELAPQSAPTLANLAWTDYFEGKLRVRAGLDPGDLLGHALEASTRAHESSSSASALLCRASAWRLEAEWRLRSRGAEGLVVEPLQEARADLEQLLDLNPRHAEAHRSLGRLLTLEARWRRLGGEDPASSLAAAGEWLHKALELEPEGADFYLALARLALEEGGEEARRRGLEQVRKALELRPGWMPAEGVRRGLLETE